MVIPPLTLGIEEEYMIIDPETRALASYVEPMLTEGRAVLGEHVKAEFMQSQIEVAGQPCPDVRAARAELVRLRRAMSDVAARHGKRIAAASTHPFSSWRDQTVSAGERYADLYVDMQDVARRLVIFGMHVHLGFGQSEEALALTIDIMNQIRYFLPHILALSTSSPFWHGRETGLKSYRCVIFESLPRTGIPPTFDSYEEYERMVGMLAKVGSLGKGASPENPARIWWDVRPNRRIGTLEVRIADICTTIDEAMCITALIQSIAAMLIKLRAKNQSWRVYRSALIQENKWRAARYGIEGHLIDFGQEQAVSVSALWEEILGLLDGVVDELGARKDVEYVRTILKHGTSADRQLATYRRAVREGLTDQEALVQVMDQVLAETLP
ncbi:MAG: carboxylate-amine ligase [Aggregatilineales bacterium]